MPHVTFIHGIANKPPKEALHRLWLHTLAEAGLDLAAAGVSARMVYWADVLYAEPEANAQESAAADVPDAARDVRAPVPRTPEERSFLEGLRSAMTAAGAAGGPPPATESSAADGPAMVLPMERFPIPWPLKERFLETYLRDVHHYLFDSEFSPRPGTVFRVQQEIRRRFLEALNDPAIEGPHLVVSHSMGTVVAYDCLKRVGECPRVDGLMTIGSPLGIDEVQDRLQPEWRRHDGFPSATLRGPWSNVADRLDVVCGLDPRLANDFREGGAAVVADHFVENAGWWRHGIVQYLRQPSLVTEMRRMLGLGAA